MQIYFAELQIFFVTQGRPRQVRKVLSASKLRHSLRERFFTLSLFTFEPQPRGGNLSKRPVRSVQSQRRQQDPEIPGRRPRTPSTEGRLKTTAPRQIPRRDPYQTAA